MQEEIKGNNPTGIGGFRDNPQNRNDGGRIKNSLKEFQRQEFEKMSDEEKREYLKNIDNYRRWTMAEGNPKQDTDVTSGGEKIMFVSEESQKRYASDISTKEDSSGPAQV